MLSVKSPRWFDRLWLACFALLLAIGIAGAGESSNHPASGQSLFDDLFLVGSEYELPQPFANLVARIESGIGLSASGEANRTRAVLIPVGRCIDRYAADPNYFRFPRIVLAVDSQSRYPDSGATHFLKDRIFLGYQKSSESLNVISYNDQIGRFEFQTVTGYRPGSTARVRYADRRRCVGCHQNAGPIFPRAGWDETNNNPDVLARMAQDVFSTEFAGALPRANDAHAIDSSTNRAGMFSVYQQYWRQACQAQTVVASINCRAGLFESVLRQALTGAYRATARSKRVSDYLAPASAGNFERRWPHGLVTSSPDIDNRNPLSGSIAQHLEAARELARPRSDHIRWYQRDVPRIVSGLKEQLPWLRLQRLDDLVYRTALAQPDASSALDGECRLRKSYTDSFVHEMEDTGEMFINCLFNNNIINQVRLSGGISVMAGYITSRGIYDSIILGTNRQMGRYRHDGGRLRFSDGRWSFNLGLRNINTGLHGRLSGGELVEQIEISWSASAATAEPFGERREVRATGVLKLVLPGEIIENALENMVTRNRLGESDLFSDKPFRGAQLLDALNEEIQKL